MHGLSASGLAASRKSTDQHADQMVSDADDRWFVDVVQTLLPKDAGLALHLSTGFEERSCYRYASGDRKPPGYFIRSLLRTDDGWQWLSGFMEGSDAQWWLDLQLARDIVTLLEKRK